MISKEAESKIDGLRPIEGTIVHAKYRMCECIECYENSLSQPAIEVSNATADALMSRKKGSPASEREPLTTIEVTR
jgi:hypothetical protein